MFTLRQYLTTLADTHGLTRTLGEIEVCRDGKGRICYSAGNSAVVFRIRCEGRVRSLRCYMHHPRHLAEIYGEKLLPQELFIYTSPAGGVWVDVVLSDWIEGVTLHEAVAAAAETGDTARLRRFAAAFDRMAAALTADDWAHGDLKPENIVADNRGRLHLIDFDAMFLPAFAGRHSPELGTAAFQHPARTVRDFDASLDDAVRPLFRCRRAALHAAEDRDRRGALRGARALRAQGTRGAVPDCTVASFAFAPAAGTAATAGSGGGNDGNG